MTEWQPIKTAPDTGIFLVYCPDAWESERTLLVERTDPGGDMRIHIDDQIVKDATHWAPLPAPPTS